MRVFVKQNKTPDGRLFTVYDELFHEKYEVSRVKNRILLLDKHKKAHMRIKQMPLPALKAYSITADRRNAKFFINPNMTSFFYGVAWHIRGDLGTNSFDVISADNSVVAVHCKRFCEAGDCCELNIEDDRDELLCLGISVCVNLSARVEKLVAQTV